MNVVAFLNKNGDIEDRQMGGGKRVDLKISCDLVFYILVVLFFHMAPVFLTDGLVHEILGRWGEIVQRS